MKDLIKAKRGGNQFGGSAPAPLLEARRIKAVNLLMLGHSYRQIAAELGVSHTTVSKDIKHQLTDYRESSKQSIDNWRGLMTMRYEAKLVELHERGDEIKNNASLNEATKAGLLDGINKTELQIYKALREMHALDIRQDEMTSQHQVTHFVLRPGGALDLDKPKEDS
tara:strand:+ start:2654 stop:3154 length:501 start_codon:yes stop_codon:yes gene_type:complete